MKMDPSKAAEIAKFIDVFVNTKLTIEEVLAQYKPEEVLSTYKPEEVFSRYKAEEILAGLNKNQLKELKKQLNYI